MRAYAAGEVGHRHLMALRTPVRAATRDERDDEFGQARLAVIGASVELGDTTIANELRPWLRDERPLVRLLALAYVGHLPALRAVVAQMAEHDAMADLRDQAELMLALLGDAAARARVLLRTDQASFRVQMTLDADATRPRLLRVLAAPANADSEMDFIVRSSAASTLLSQGDARGREALHQMIASAGPGPQLPLLQLLAPFATEADVDALVPLLASSNDLVRVEAAATFWKITQGQGAPESAP